MTSERAAVPLAPPPGRGRLLVVDDDPDVRDSLERALRHAGYAVTTAVHGADALDSVARSPVDLIVLDVMMPMVDGFDACRILRARGDATPVLVLTAREAIDDRVTGLEVGADDYLVKPFALRELMARVRALLRRSQAGVTELARGEPVSSAFGDVRLDEVVAAGLEGPRRDWPQTPFTADLEPYVVVGSAERLQVAVRNLLDNAAKFGPPGAAVEVRLVGGELTVRDRGPGIAPADLPGVFDRFYRAASARAVPGSGLGLSIVRQVAESHGGTVRAESAPGGGTLIRLRLPGRTSEDRGRAFERASAATAAVPGREYSSRR